MNLFKMSLPLRRVDDSWIYGENDERSIAHPYLGHERFQALASALPCLGGQFPYRL